VPVRAGPADEHPQHRTQPLPPPAPSPASATSPPASPDTSAGHSHRTRELHLEHLQAGEDAGGRTFAHVVDAGG
jgi:hypothetical protein